MPTTALDPVSATAARRPFAATATCRRSAPRRAPPEPRRLSRPARPARRDRPAPADARQPGRLRAAQERSSNTTLWMSDVLQTWAWNPQYYNDTASNAIYSLIARDFAPWPERFEYIVSRMEKIPAYLRAVARAGRSRRACRRSSPRRCRSRTRGSSRSSMPRCCPRSRRATCRATFRCRAGQPEEGASPSSRMDRRRPRAQRQGRFPPRCRSSTTRR